MTARILVRLATAGDVPALVDLLHAAYAEYRDRLDPPSGAFRESIASIGDLRIREAALVADQGGRLVGCVFYQLTDNDGAINCWMHRLAVLPAHRRQGIGAQLVAGVEAAAWAARAQSVTLGVRIPLTDNHRFYLDLGYRIVEARIHDGYEFPTWYLMQKRRGAIPTSPFAVVVVPYDPHWPDQFAAEAARIAPALGDNLLEIRHVGSTSVPGLAAKPIIDMMPIVRDIRLVDVATAQMVDLGYEPMGEFGLPGRRFFRRSVDGLRTHHVHIYAQNDPDVARHADFVAYLSAHPDEAARYGALKHQLAAAHPNDANAYMDGKNGLIKELEARAEQWATSHEVRVSSS